MTASLSRFAYKSPMQAGERRTVRHVIGSRALAEDSVRMLGATGKEIRRNGANSYAF